MKNVAKLEAQIEAAKAELAEARREEKRREQAAEARRIARNQKRINRAAEASGLALSDGLELAVLTREFRALADRIGGSEHVETTNETVEPQTEAPAQSGPEPRPAKRFGFGRAE